jgi:16S rRNA (guanine527-N7)-methyltransferase
MAELAEWLGLSLSVGQHEQLESYGRWLASEAVAAGGIGPHEAERLFDRHVGDALTYLSQIPSSAESLVDVGSGVGLPGIPIAIARPDLAVTLLDRSGRRVDLASRALRVIGLATATPVHGDARDLAQAFDVAVFRASLRTSETAGIVSRVTTTGGRGIVGLSRRPEAPQPPAAPGGLAAEVVRLTPPMLDSPVWLLRMHRSAE